MHFSRLLCLYYTTTRPFFNERQQAVGKNRGSGTPRTVYFLKVDGVSYPNLDKNTNTKTNTETNKGKTTLC